MNAIPLPLLTRLLAEARAGSADALNRLLETCRPLLHRRARRLLHPRFRARLDGSDLVQEVLCNAARGFGDFRGDTYPTLLAWLYRILANTAQNACKHHDAACRDPDREVPLPGDDSSHEGADALILDTPSPGNKAARAEAAQALTAAVSRLPEHYRAVFVAHSLHRQTFEEIGRQTGQSADAARMTWYRALECLKQEIGPYA